MQHRVRRNSVRDLIQISYSSLNPSYFPTILWLKWDLILWQRSQNKYSVTFNPNSDQQRTWQLALDSLLISSETCSFYHLWFLWSSIHKIITSSGARFSSQRYPHFKACAWIHILSAVFSSIICLLIQIRSLNQCVVKLT